MRAFTVEERRARLARRHFLAHDAARTADLTTLTGAVIGWHATDPATPYLSLWSRVHGFGTADLDRELYERRTLVKQLAMRRTLWLVDAAHLPMLQPAVADRVAESEERRLIADIEKAGVCADGRAWLNRATAAVLGHLAVHPHASSSELRQALPELDGTYNPAPGKSYGAETPLAPRVLTVLGARGQIVRGPNDVRWTASRPRWAAGDSWLGPARENRSADDAFADLTRRWLRSFGPATIEDVKWWFGSTMAAVRRALTENGAVEVDLHGTPGWALPDDLEPEQAPAPWVALLPGLDVTTMGWFGRDWYLGDHRAQLFDRNGNAGPTAWCDGRVVGGWRQDTDGRVQLQLLEDPGRAARQALVRRAAELTEWLDGVRISPRFPSPLSKAGPT